MPTLMDSRNRKPAATFQSAAPIVAPVPFVKVARRGTGRLGNVQAWQNSDGGGAVPPPETMEKASATNSTHEVVDTGKPKKKKKIELMSELNFEEQDPVYFPSPAPQLICGAGEMLEQDDYGTDVSIHRPGRFEEVSHPMPRWLRLFFCTADEPTEVETSSRYSKRDSPVDFDDSQNVKSVAL